MIRPPVAPALRAASTTDPPAVVMETAAVPRMLRAACREIVLPAPATRRLPPSERSAPELIANDDEAEFVRMSGNVRPLAVALIAPWELTYPLVTVKELPVSALPSVKLAMESLAEAKALPTLSVVIAEAAEKPLDEKGTIRTVPAVSIAMVPAGLEAWTAKTSALSVMLLVEDETKGDPLRAPSVMVFAPFVLRVPLVVVTVGW